MASMSASDQHALDNANRITLDAVVEALVNLRDLNGTTLTNLKRYFVNKFPSHVTSTALSSRIKKVLKKGVGEGKIRRDRKRRYFLCNDNDDGGSKKRRNRLDNDAFFHHHKRRRRSKGKKSKKRRRRRRGCKRRRGRRGRC
ncbi:unnamed protein product [Candidula unifasciata]|uniref:H15 domain-containing protein n=1 Tax=Candidula unifasciata TaxID=100452 RepID=A0A8S3ZKM8_9EUPU|nr:unnamed protein product [Candidula unifasciata]